MSFESDLTKKYLNSKQVKFYYNKRKTLKDLYKSERKTLQYLKGKYKSVIDIGCCTGNLSQVFPKKISYCGIDIDEKAIKQARLSNPQKYFIKKDFLRGETPKAELVIAFNLIDQYKDWKKAIKQLCKHSTKYVNFSTLLRLNGETVTDQSLSFSHYSNGKEIVLWGIHNLYSIIAYCSSKEINASSIYVYCYRKRIINSVHPLPDKDLYVGNIVLEINKKKAWAATGTKPKLKIEINAR